MDPEIIKRYARARIEDIQVIRPPDDRLRAFLMLFGIKRMLIIKSTEQNADEVVGKLRAYAEASQLVFEELHGEALTEDDVRGDPEIVFVDNQPYSRRKKPDYWPLPDQRKMIVVDGISGLTDIEVLRSFLYVACLGGNYDRKSIAQDKLPDGSGFVFVAGKDFPFEGFASISGYWHEERAVFDATDLTTTEEAVATPRLAHPINAQQPDRMIKKEPATLISRFLTDDDLERMKTDFDFLLKMVRDSKGEMTIELRGGDRYFNLYYRGNSLAKVTALNSGTYRIDINKAFYAESKAKKDEKFRNMSKLKGDYWVIANMPSKLLHPFFKQAYINDLCSQIRNRNYGEEITFEQMLMTDNREREDLILIDRQVTDRELKRQMDILALRQIEGNRYEFLILEGKLGKNSELESKVFEQVDCYANHISNHFDSYKLCYERVYYQKRNELQLFTNPGHESIEIVRGEAVDARVVVFGYSGMAEVKIQSLRKKFPNVRVWRLDFRLNIPELDAPPVT